MFQGYSDGKLTWYVCTDTSNFRQSQTEGLTFSPKLESAYLTAAPLYVVLNPGATQGPVFSAQPGDANYSGIWTVWNVTWTNLSARVPLISESQILDAQAAGDLIAVPSDPHIVVDYPIVSLGTLGCPGPNGPDRYTIPQFIDLDAGRKTITLPTYDVSCSDGTTMEPMLKKIIIPDVGDAALASVLKANLAPGLLAIDALNEQKFWFRRGPKPPSELPIVEFCPNNFANNNKENGYSPIMQYIILHSNIPPSTVVNNKKYLLTLIGNGGLVVVKSDQVINAPIMPARATVEVCALAIQLYLFDWFVPDGDVINLTVNGVRVLTNFVLPTFVTPFQLPVILRRGDNIVKITALNQGAIGPNTAGIAFSNACPDFINFLFGVHVDIFALRTGETATILVRAP